MLEKEIKFEPITTDAEWCINERGDVANQWLETAVNIAETIQLPEALELANFLQNNTGLGIVLPENKTARLVPPESKLSHAECAFLTPIIKQDQYRLAHDDPRLVYTMENSVVAATFVKGSRSIYLPNKTISRQAKGVILLHEAKHAVNDIYDIYDSENPMSHWIEEAETYIFEFNVLKALGGESYTNLIATEIEAFKLQNLEIFAKQDKKAAKLWKEIFGNDISSEEVETWNFVAQLNARWQYYSENSEDPVRLLADFIKSKTSTIN